MQFFDFQAQYLEYKQEIDAAIQEVLDSSKYILGPQVEELERSLGQFVGSDCLTTSSGTDSLIMALMALGIKEGDEIITTPFTWVATGEVIARMGATPVFIDIDPDTYNMDPNLIEAAITEKTKVIMPVSLFGQMANYPMINAIAKRYNLIVIEDGAQSFGATQDGKPSCSVTKIGATSFFPTKPLGCYGDGGAVFTTDQELLLKMRAIRTHGALVRHDHFCIGMNGRFDTIQAAIVSAKFKHFKKERERCVALAAIYNEGLKDVCKIPALAKGNTHVYAQYTIQVENRDELAAELKEKGIPTGIYYPKCIHLQTGYLKYGYKCGDLPVAEKAAREVLSLPMHPFLKEAQQRKIIESIIQGIEVLV